MAATLYEQIEVHTLPRANLIVSVPCLAGKEQGFLSISILFGG